jgi:hypothetical protein
MDTLEFQGEVDLYLFKNVEIGEMGSCIDTPEIFTPCIHSTGKAPPYAYL